MTILQALSTRYDRLSQSDNSTLPPYGYSYEKIDFAIVIDADGKLVGVETVAEPGSGERRAVPKNPTVTRTSRVYAMFLWDKSSYVLGLTETPKARTTKEHAAFKARFSEVAGGSEDVGLRAVQKFLYSWEPSPDHVPRFQDEMLDRNLVFRLDGEQGYIHERAAARSTWLAYLEGQSGPQGICLVSGESGLIALTHPQIGGVRGAQSSGAAIVSFNLDAFRSYGKEQNANAPVSAQCAFKYAAALNDLLRKNSINRIQLGDTTTVFWAEAEDAETSEAAESWFAAMASPPDESDENANLRSMMLEMEKGRPLREVEPDLSADTRFYILGLAPNAARISIRFWHDTTMGDLGRAFYQHWRDMRFEQPRPRGLPPSVAKCALMTAPARTNAQGQLKLSFDDMSPLLSGELMRAILTKGRYPGALLANLVMRIRSDSVLHPTRIALIKAIIVRAMRIENRLPYEEYLMRSDPDDPNPARRLGRLFAVIERAQLAALGDNINATVKDKFIGSAAATPGNVFPGLIKNAQPHIARLRRGHSDATNWIKTSEHARRMSFVLERDIARLWGAFPDGAPTHQTIEDQGLFFVGYYQERFGGRPDQDLGREPGVDTEDANSDNEE